MGQINSSDSRTCDDNLENIIDTKSNISLTINGVKYDVPEYTRTDITLNHFIRNAAKLKGTKYMCLEGGCGVCIVAVKINNQVLAVNSCLVPIFLCNGWQVITIEGIGGALAGYNSLQKTLAEMNGSQCGYCSPAMIMNMYSLIKRGKISREEIENSFGSNICRCTGYRSILDAFHLFSNNLQSNSSTNVADIEDLCQLNTCKESNKVLTEGFDGFENINNDEIKPIYLKLKDAEFFKVFSVGQIFEIFIKYPNSSYILNGGNTGNGVYRIGKKNVYIDINDVTELKRIHKTEDTLIFESGVTLENMIKYCDIYSKHAGFEYLNQLAHHINLIGHVAMRNIGTIAGNLMLKHQNREFPSDLCLSLETIGADIHILETKESKVTMKLIEFLQIDMRHKLIYSIVLPQLSSKHKFKSFKIMPRAQNAHATVNAGFLFELDDKYTVITEPNIIFGGINPNFLHASKTEKFLTGKNLLDKTTLKEALNILGSEIKPDNVLPDNSPEYRKKLAQSLFYKFILSLKPDQVDSKLRSGATILERGVSHGKVDYDVDKNIWPINKPVHKIEALHQTSGEAEYVNDIPERHNEMFCAFVLAEKMGRIKNIDASEALKMDGVIAFYTAKDVPGKNICVKKGTFLTYFDQVLFAEDEIQYSGQPYGLIVANLKHEAQDAAKKVKLTYVDEPCKRPLITIQDVLASNDKSRVQLTKNFPAKKKPGNDVKYEIKGTFSTNSQYHYTMEPHCCVCIPLEDELDVFVTTHSVTSIKRNLSVCLGIMENKINAQVRRVGGSYGAKISLSSMVACACAMAAFKLKRPARMDMTIEDTMKSLGKRSPMYQEYEIGVNDSGKIQYLNTEFWSNEGINSNDSSNNLLSEILMLNCYDTTTWNVKFSSLVTDVPSNTWCRAPGPAEGLAMHENIMEHVAKITKQDSIKVRLENLNLEDIDLVNNLTQEIIKCSDYYNRRDAIDAFNKENRWKKRGIGFNIMKYPIKQFFPLNALVSIYAEDGTVAVTHGGIEMGQGINTKVAQVAAYTLGIDMKFVRIKPFRDITSPNAGISGGSIASDCSASATKAACEELNRRLQPIKAKLNNPTWQELVKQASSEGVDLCATHLFNSKTDIPKPYVVYGAAVAEVEIDILTGEYIIQRVDILEDTGISMNPEIDVGQIQGAFVMGLGMWTTEELCYDPSTGALVNHRTWNYKPPGAKDIPVDFRISFLRNSPNPLGVLRSKATGEPGLCMSYSIPLAIRYALNSARSDAGNNDDWYNIDGPATIEKIMLTGLTQEKHMVL